MRLGVLKRILQEDLNRTKDVDAKFLALLGPLNEFIEQVGTALTNKLTFADNFSVTERTVKLQHGIETEVNSQAGRMVVTGVLLTNPGAQMVTGFKWLKKNNGNIAVTVEFKEGPGTLSQVTLLILLG